MTSTSYDIWVFDSSVLIQIQRSMTVQSRDNLLRQMAQLAQEECLVFPRRVTEELTSHAQRDAVAKWALRVRQFVPRHYVPDDELVKEVLRVAPKLVPATQLRRSADAHVVAQALAYQRENMFNAV